MNRFPPRWQRTSCETRASTCPGAPSKIGRNRRSIYSDARSPQRHQASSKHQRPSGRKNPLPAFAGTSTVRYWLKNRTMTRSAGTKGIQGMLICLRHISSMQRTRAKARSLSVGLRSGWCGCRMAEVHMRTHRLLSLEAVRTPKFERVSLPGDPTTVTTCASVNRYTRITR